MVQITKISKNLSHPRVKEIQAKRRIEDKKVVKAVEQVVERVRKEGDRALFFYTQKFDGASLKKTGLKVKSAEIRDASKQIDKKYLSVLKLAIRRITAYHRRQATKSWWVKVPQSKDGLGQLVQPLKRVGIYIPGGKAAYPSSVLMNAIPAKVAGVAEIAMCVPPDPSGKVNPHTLVAAQEVGIKEIYRVGGAQAIAALAYGTQTVKPVDKITGPGNIYVTLAKKMVVGAVDIDMLAGPSEVVILADSTGNPSFIAADMLAQAEHDEKALAVLITTSKALAKKVTSEIDVQLKDLKRKRIAKKALEKNGKTFLVSSLRDGLDLVNLIAPEHLELMVKKPTQYLSKIRNAGAIFLGNYTPEAYGDYIAGSNHVLPTSGTARFYSPLGVYDFVKATSVVKQSKSGLAKLARAISVLAEAEGLEAHARSVKKRL